MKTIAISQRIAVAPGSGELRDCLARDWYPFLDALEVLALPLPNDSRRALDLVAAFPVEGLLLTGGDDIGVFPERDETEAALVEWCEARNIPIIGVCRGFQLMAHRLGAELIAVDPDIHRARRHRVVFAGGESRAVNSYHNLGVSIADARGFSLTPLAWCETDRSLEAVASAKDLAIMWHPEREETPDPADLLLFRRFLKMDGKT